VVCQSRLTELLDYAPETGKFCWKVRRKAHGGYVLPDDVAGHLSDRGYVFIGIDGVIYRAHRLAWLYVTGLMPDTQIDHVNGDRADNRWGNLRSATNALNAQNLRRPHRDNRTGYLGVTKHAGGKFAAHISIDGKVRHIGLFADAISAHKAY
jgi:hypothetical protein